MPFTWDCPRKTSIFSMIIRISHQKIIHVLRDDPQKAPFRWWISMVPFCFRVQQRFQAASDWPSSSKMQRLASWPWWKPWRSPWTQGDVAIDGDFSKENRGRMGEITRPGKHTKSYWKWPFTVDFPINSMVIFHSYVTVYQRVYPIKSH